MEFATENIQPAVLCEDFRNQQRSWPASAQALAPASQVLFIGAFLAFLQMADGVLTTMGVNRFGIHIEGNPLLRSLMEQFGHVPTLAFLKLIAIMIVLALTILAKQLPWVKNAMSAVSCIYLFAAILPWTYILFIKPYI